MDHCVYTMICTIISKLYTKTCSNVISFPFYVKRLIIVLIVPLWKIVEFEFPTYIQNAYGLLYNRTKNKNDEIILNRKNNPVVPLSKSSKMSICIFPVVYRVSQKKRNPYRISKYPNSFKTQYFWTLQKPKELSFDRVKRLWSSIRVAGFFGTPGMHRVMVMRQLSWANHSRKLNFAVLWFFATLRLKQLYYHSAIFFGTIYLFSKKIWKMHVFFWLFGKWKIVKKIQVAMVTKKVGLWMFSWYLLFYINR